MGSLSDPYVDVNDPTLQIDNFGGYKIHGGGGNPVSSRIAGLRIGGFPSDFWCHTKEKMTDFVVAHGSMRLAVGSLIALTPNVLYQVLPNSKNQWQGTAQLEVKEKFWAMAGYRSNKSLLAGAGVKLNKLELAYAYSANGGMLNDLSNGGHELMLSFGFSGKGKDKTKTESNTPLEE